MKPPQLQVLVHLHSSVELKTCKVEGGDPEHPQSEPSSSFEVSLLAKHLNQPWVCAKQAGPPSSPPSLEGSSMLLQKY